MKNNMNNSNENMSHIFGVGVMPRELRKRFIGQSQKRTRKLRVHPRNAKITVRYPEQTPTSDITYAPEAFGCFCKKEKPEKTDTTKGMMHWVV